jgi:hypothetical protein
MMTTFPLYDTLINTVQASQEEPVDKNKLVKWIHTLDQDGKNKVYALIRYFAFNHNLVQEPEIIPFGGHFSEGELVFDLDKLPLLLQRVLFEFSKLHIQHMKDIQKIEKIRKKSSMNNK